MSVETARARRRGVAVPYDFRTPNRVSREHARLLEIAFETFARQWATQLATSLSCPTGVTLVAVTQRTYDEYVDGLVSPTALVPFVTDAALGHGVLQLSTQTALAHVDHALGGPGGEQPHRELTEIEASLTRGLIARALGTLEYAFAAVAPLTAGVEDLQQNPQLMQVARAGDALVVAQFSILVGTLELPATMMLQLTPLVARMAAAAATDTRSSDELEAHHEQALTLAGSVAEVPMDVSVRLTTVASSPERVLALAVGDLVRVPHPTGRPLEVAAADIVFAHAVATVHGNRQACLITSTEENPR